MFKKITASMLLLTFVVQTFSAPFIRLDYFFNSADYARNCVNKARPKMNCNGKCQVMKKIQKEQEKEQKDQESKMNSKVDLVSSRSYYTITTTSDYFELIKRNYFLRNEATEIKMPHTVFHPPSI